MALLEFYMVGPTEVPQFLPVANALQEQGDNVAFYLPPAPGSGFDNFKIRRCARALEKAGVPYSREHCQEADAVITTTLSYMLPPCYENMTRIRMHYGLGLLSEKAMLHSPEGAGGFHGLLVHGQYSKDKISAYYPEERIFTMGFPKHDDVLQGGVSSQQAKSLLGIPETDKKILVYLPTWERVMGRDLWAQHCSIDAFADAIASLKDDWLVVVKPHHSTWGTGNDKHITMLGDLADVMLDWTLPISHIPAIADAVLADAKSGCLCEVALLRQDVPLFALSPLSTEEIQGSFDPRLYKVAPVFNDPEKLRHGFSSMVSHLAKSSRFLREREGVLEYLWACRDGRGAQAAAKAVTDILHMEQ